MGNPEQQAGGSPADYAHAYAELGWRVLPIRPGEKRPPMTAWRHAATTSHAAIDNWFNNLYRGHGVGIATGVASGVWVLDVDNGPGKHGDDSMDMLATMGALPVTVEAQTGGFGRHLVFEMPAGVEVRNTASLASWSGLDVRGEGGQIVAAPTVHPNGRPYTWLDGQTPWDMRPAPTPGWLLNLVAPPPELIVPPEVAPRPGASDRRGIGNTDADSIAALINERNDWPSVLTADGWVAHTLHPAGGHGAPRAQPWTRPGKDARDGASALLHLPDGPLVIWSTDDSLVALQRPEARTAAGDGWSYSMFGYLAATRFGGDRSKCARHYRGEYGDTNPVDLAGLIAPVARLAGVEVETFATTSPGLVARVRGSVVPTPAPFDLALAHMLDIVELYDGDHGDEDWLAYPVVPRGRALALYAPAKAGKSSVVLALAAALATGRPLLGGPIVPVEHVLYLDYEMTAADLLERLVELGYTRDDDWSHLHYALLPSIPPLDTRAGAEVVVYLARLYGAQLVVIDTFGRAVEGDENEADTARAFYRHTGLALKSAGVACLRTDHSGKDIDKGQRGSSAKNDDVDIVWQLTRLDNGVTLKRTHSRISWVPDEVKLARSEDEDGVRWSMMAGAGYPPGTADMVAVLDRLGVADQATGTAALRAMRDAGEKGRTTIVKAAQRARRERPLKVIDGSGTPPGTPQKGGVFPISGNTSEQFASPLVDGRNTPREHLGTPLSSTTGGGGVPYKEHPASAGPETDPGSLY